MKKELFIRTIDPLSVAEKLSAIRNFLLPEITVEIEARPRLVEAMWFLQWISLPENYAGGLAKFAADLVTRYASEVGPEALLSVKGGNPTGGAIAAALDSFPHSVREELLAGQSGELLANILDHHTSPTDQNEIRAREERRADALQNLTFGKLHKAAVNAARTDLAEFLHAVCSDPECRFDGAPSLPCYENRIWHFPRLWECVFAWMDEHAAREKDAIAETAITKEIYHWLELAQDSGKGVMFIGHSRHGKSRAVRAFAGMYPGLVRIVECPSSGGDGEILRAVSLALGIRYDRATTPPLPDQRAAIDAVVRQARFLLIFDEAQFLFPQRGKSRAVPYRLNYVRRSIMDAGIPTAFICTHQAWKDVDRNFLKVSAYSMEQFEGRLLRPPLHLKSELSEEEMMAVAAKHLPEHDSDYLKVVVSQIRAFNGGDHLSSIENIAIISRRYAREDGLPYPQLKQLQRAIDDVLGCSGQASASVSQPVTTVPARRNVHPSQPVRSTRPAGFSSPDRGMKPAAGVA